jgi:hypothetical protein
MKCEGDTVLLEYAMHNNENMRDFVENNNLLLDFTASTRVLCQLGQIIADVWDLNISFDVAYIKDPNNYDTVNTIMMGMRTILGKDLWIPYDINDQSISVLSTFTGSSAFGPSRWVDSLNLTPFLVKNNT